MIVAMRKSEQNGQEIYRHSAKLVAMTSVEYYRRYPDIVERYGPQGRRRTDEDIHYHYQTLAEAMIAEESNMFLRYVAWVKSVLVNRKVRGDYLVDCLLIMQEVITDVLGGAIAEVASSYIELALDSFDSFAELPPSCIDSASTLSNLANGYLEALLSSDLERAREVLRSAERSGLSFKDVCEYVLQPVQREVGRLWQVNQITVAQEHYSTASTERLMAEFEPPASSRHAKEDQHFFVGACVAGEQHSIGLRVISECLETSGWRVYFTGANTPSASLTDLVRRGNVNVIGLSCATVLNLPALRQLVTQIRQCPKPTRIMVGGRIFNEFPSLWKKVGADAYAEDATSAMRVAEKLVGAQRASAVKG